LRIIFAASILFNAAQVYAAPVVLNIPNFESDGPACVVRAPAGRPPPQIDLSCLPKSAPTGFEKPSPEARVQSIRSPNATGHLLLQEDDLMFCLYGQQTNLCGAAIVHSAAEVAAIKAYAQALELGDNDVIKFSPAPGLEVRLQSGFQQVELSYDGHSETIAVDTEKPLRIKVADYNFDGHLDFSISHVDDGMGTYDLYDIYVYAPKEKKFVLLQPKCGDAFINVALAKRERALINSYMVQGRYKTCKMKF
jgi:hypothetical protein